MGPTILANGFLPKSPRKNKGASKAIKIVWYVMSISTKKEMKSKIYRSLNCLGK